MRRKNDILWKGLLEIVFDDLLRFIFPEADQQFDLQRGFEFLDKELAEMYPEPEKKTDTRFVDKLVKVFHRNGAEEWILIHIEVQGETNDRSLFSERMFRYFYRIFDRYRKPVAAIAIFTGRNGKHMPDAFEYSFLKTRLEYRYHTLCILDYQDEELAGSENPFALVMLAAKQALLKGKDLDKTLLAGKLFIFRKLYDKGIFGKPKMEAVLSFLNNYVRFEKPQTNRIFMEEINKITGQKNTMDIFEQVAELKAEEARKEGEAKGRAKEREEFVKKLLESTEFSVKKIANLANVTEEFVKKVKKKSAK